MRESDDAEAAGHRPAFKRRKRRDEILAEAAASKHVPRAPRGLPGGALWRSQRAARISVTTPPTQPQVPATEPPTAPNGDPKPDRSRWANLPILAVLAVLVTIGGVAWWLHDPAVQQRSVPPTPPAGFEQIALPGHPDSHRGGMTVAAAADLNVLPDYEAELLRKGGISDVVYAGSVDRQYSFFIYAYPSAGPEAARATTETIAGIHKRLKLTDAVLDGLPSGLPAVELRNSKAVVMRTLYTSGNFTVQLSVLQKPAGDNTELRAEFRRMATLVAGILPPEPPRNAGG